MLVDFSLILAVLSALLFVFLRARLRMNHLALWHPLAWISVHSHLLVLYCLQVHIHGLRGLARAIRSLPLVARLLLLILGDILGTAFPVGLRTFHFLYVGALLARETVRRVLRSARYSFDSTEDPLDVKKASLGVREERLYVLQRLQ